MRRGKQSKFWFGAYTEEIAKKELTALIIYKGALLYALGRTVRCVDLHRTKASLV